MDCDARKTCPCEQTIDRYKRFVGEKVVSKFVSHGGKVFIASEKRPAEEIVALYDAGHRHFSEKLIRECSLKVPFLRNSCHEISIIFFGRLQRNKCRKTLRLFDAVESIDRAKLALKIARIINEDPSSVRANSFFIQVNTGREPHKGGVYPEEAQVLIDLCFELNLPIAGLMVIPPKNEPPAPHFRFLRKLADANSIRHCQMGMSDDWRIAIEEGASRIRVGRLIFGSYNDSREF